MVYTFKKNEANISLNFHNKMTQKIYVIYNKAAPGIQIINTTSQLNYKTNNQQLTWININTDRHKQGQHTRLDSAQPDFMESPRSVFLNLLHIQITLPSLRVTMHRFFHSAQLPGLANTKHKVQGQAPKPHQSLSRITTASPDMDLLRLFTGNHQTKHRQDKHWQHYI
jgi:hypothetical protein